MIGTTTGNIGAYPNETPSVMFESEHFFDLSESELLANTEMASHMQ